MPTYPALISAEGPRGVFATLESSRLIVRCAETKTLLRNIEIDSKIVANVRHMRWCPTPAVEDEEHLVRRLLVATTENVYVYDITDPRRHATIKKACGEGGKIVAVEFGAHQDEVIAFAAHSLKACVWALNTGFSTEIKDVKSPSTRTHSLRALSGHLAFLARSGVKDTLVVLRPDRNDVEYSLELGTIDAQGVKWSPDGHWIAIWDTGTAGTGVLIYTATGQLLKKFSAGGETEDLSTGVQRVEWDANSRFLLIVMNDGKCVFLKTGVFTPHMVFEYPSKFASQHAQIHIEQIAEDGTRTYQLSKDVHNPPKAESSLGFNHIALCSGSNLFASVLASLPTTVWIHTFHPNPQLTAILVHHGSIKHLSWHPSIPGLLLMHCSASGAEVPPTAPTTRLSNPHIYFWGYDMPEPKIIKVGSAGNSPITKTGWLRAATEPRALISTATACSTIAVLAPDDEEEACELPTPRPAPQQQQKYSVEATPTQILGYELQTPMTNATSDFSPIKMDTAQLTRTLGFQFTSLDDCGTDDTFDYKRLMKT